ncbi:alpha/beta fold hydrolase [Mucilaginibacter paludis]|uniref:AB hydrolase-1 domain-containing protein n=1 Tax=Mucilaginibacter paludis DSM 18603 TaxID=714943 RepID=H1YAU9_9SPHI|nr:alpha/beta hydrolase [Mucilaginibacter paludis]EHQ29558.1 hypothetical protein Mucpa_5486 [Mucilaginibacter paludis DSM 18603]
MSKLFLISGLGADERLFSKLDLSGFDVVAIPWIKPGPHDTLATYAARLIREFGIVPQSSVIGVSLGGMLTVEVARQVQLKHAIIISSIKSAHEAPRYFKFFRSRAAQVLVSGKLAKTIGLVLMPVFGQRPGSEGGQIFSSMLKDSDAEFLTWAMHAVLDWSGNPVSSKINHIIGEADLVFHQRKIKDAIVVPKGDHLMVYVRAAEISGLIRGILQS